MRIRTGLVVGAIALGALTLHGTAGAGAATTTHVGDRWNGKTVTIAPGDTLVATLGSTYWTFGPTPSNLSALGPAVTHVGGPGCPSFPGSGCGTVAKRFRAVHAGVGVLTASRTTCGEAMRCAPGASRWRVTVQVRAATRAIVSGHVMSSPSCPVERADQPCPSRPVTGNVQAVRDGKVVATSATDAGGRYELSLPPATYDLRVDVHASLPRCPTKRLSLAAGPHVVDFDCDSGIR